MEIHISIDGISICKLKTSLLSEMVYSCNCLSIDLYKILNHRIVLVSTDEKFEIKVCHFKKICVHV